MSTALRRRLTALLLLALAWVWAGPGMQQPALQGLAHEWVHLQSQAHHHHPDASLHLDAADAAEPSHQHASDSAKPGVGHDPLAGPLHHPRPGAPVASAGPHWLSVVLESPLRPPRVQRS
jgi:hypothetical protein